jgi:hypothetical protein
VDSTVTRVTVPASSLRSELNKYCSVKLHKQTL